MKNTKRASQSIRACGLAVMLFSAAIFERGASISAGFARVVVSEIRPHA
ncbi:hypothetical protein [Bradyrhizobium sp. AZCC 2230]